MAHPIPSTMPVNNLQENLKKDRLTTAVFLKLVPTAQTALMAKAAGYDSLLIDLEHTTLSIAEGSALSMAGLASGITPFVRVPYQCGNGFVQRVLDNGAMGVVFPHCDGVEGAQAAVKICKYPPFGKRSCSAHLPHFSCATVDQSIIFPTLDAVGSTVIVMVETVACLDAIDDVAAVPGVDVILIGTFDLSTELGILGDWENPKLKAALEKVAAACKKHGKVFGVAGLNHLPVVLKWVINVLGARFVVGQGDMQILANGLKSSYNTLRALEEQK